MRFPPIHLSTACDTPSYVTNNKSDLHSHVLFTMNIELTVLPRLLPVWNVVSCCSRRCIVRLESVRAQIPRLATRVARTIVYLFFYLSFFAIADEAWRSNKKELEKQDEERKRKGRIERSDTKNIVYIYMYMYIMY